MAAARFSIGIDLGTTNSAMAYVALDGAISTEAFPVSQWDTTTSLVDDVIVPSFAYLPEHGTSEQLGITSSDGCAWVAGRLARRKAGDMPDRVAYSAKSWLGYHAVDRSDRFLPWGSRGIAAEYKLSPISVSALILSTFRSAWDTRFADAGADFRFDAQEITITVPASFDAAAQNMTLRAALDAGFPAKVRLLEEPQAAFLQWLESNQSIASLEQRFSSSTTVRVLVIDIGGGTSDFSLFDVSLDTASAVPKITRTAVSDHILLGGDNIDLTLAHFVEGRLASNAGSLSPGQWSDLVARCREVKELALSDKSTADDRFTIAIAGRGSNLMATSMSADVSRHEIDTILLDGFFPPCDYDEKPKRGKMGLKELGLPYAADSAITRHLAAFLADHGQADAILFNGGSLYPAKVRQRILDAISRWQNDRTPIVLENAEPDLAVARGAALSGKLHHLRETWIEAGAGQAIFVEALGSSTDTENKGQRTRLAVCVLPRGASPGQAFTIDTPSLHLRLNQPVRFQAFSSTRRRKCHVGDVLNHNDEDLQPLPPLETVAKLGDGQGGTNKSTIPVTLAAQINELGLLRVKCESKDADIDASWPLEFNLRASDHHGATGPRDVQAVATTEPNAPPDLIKAGQAELENALSKPLGRKEKINASRVLKNLEGTLKMPRNEWNWVVVRGFWPTLQACMTQRNQSAEHEETWFMLAGFVLRPGFGAPLDATRIDALWTVREAGLCFPGKRLQLQEYILWRRVAGGLSRERQERLLERELKKLLTHDNPPPELLRMAGALERVGHEPKTQLVPRLIEMVQSLAKAGKHCLPHLAALEALLNRSPLYAGPECVVSPDFVEHAFEAFVDLDWTDAELVHLQSVFLRGARIINNKALDVPKDTRKRIAAKLEKSGVSSQMTAKLKQFSALRRIDQASLYGETLPPGLILQDD